MRKKIYIRFDSGGKVGLGHAIRCFKIIKLFRKEDIIICCNSETKKIFKINKYKTIIKKNNELEQNYLKRILKKSNNSKIIIDTIFKYDKKNLLKIEKNNNYFYFIHNFKTNFTSKSKVIFPIDYYKLKNYLYIKKKTKFVYFGKKYVLPGINYKIRKNDNIVVNFGGSDPKNITLKLMKKLNDENIKLNFIFLIGKAYKYIHELKRRNKLKNIKIRNFSKKLFFSSNIAIASFGLSSYELLNNNVFVFNISHSKKHSMNAKLFETKYRYSKDLGTYKEVKKINFLNKINNLKKKRFHHNQQLFGNNFELSSLNQIKKIINSSPN